MSRIEKMISSRIQHKQKVFVAYFTAGDPSLAEASEISLDLAASGVDILEWGVPFSDPLADGPTNQRSAERALAQGVSLRQILDQVALFRQNNAVTPIVIFSYLNPIFRMGFENFAARAQAAGVDGVLIVDLPPEEASDYRKIMHEHGLDTVFLASPTSDAARLRQVDAQSSGFVYYVSRTGVTGMQAVLSQSLGQEMQLVKKLVHKPVMVGFGISDAEQAIAAAQMGDGIVIGSALVKMIAEATDARDRKQKIESFATGIRQALDLHFAENI